VSADGHVQELAGNLQGRSRLPFVFAVTPQKYSVRLHLEDDSGTATIEKLELEVQSDQ